LEQGRQSGCTGIEVNAILGVIAVYVPIDLIILSPLAANYQLKEI
jgi:hypothetical protein